jgi:hypothetical protein
MLRREKAGGVDLSQVEVQFVNKNGGKNSLRERATSGGIARVKTGERGRRCNPLSRFAETGFEPRKEKLCCGVLPFPKSFSIAVRQSHQELKDQKIGSIEHVPTASAAQTSN